MIASYNEVIDGIQLQAFKFMGHGWMYVYNGKKPEEEKKLRGNEKTFEIPDVQKKNPTPSSVLLRRGSGEAENKSPRPRRSCCGGRK